jgi:AGZA family xanthine/uracil permease-like MFS transporter
MLEKLFGLGRHQTDVRTEVIAGLTTFMAMAYIIAANPMILAAAGIDKGAATLATCLVSGLVTIAMGLWANYPIALAPGMGINAFFAYAICAGMGVPWQVGLGMFFIEGIIILVITMTKLREIVIDAIPFSLKCAISVGIGLFLAFIGFENAGFIEHHPVTFVTMARIAAPAVWPRAAMAAFGLVLTTVLLAKRVKGAILLGIVAASLLSIIPIFRIPGQVPSLLSASLAPTFLKLDIIGALKLQFAVLIFTLLFVDFFDTAGTIIGVSVKAKFLDDQSRIPHIGQILAADSLGPVLGALAGTSTVTSYIESAAGIEAGGRTGLTAVVTGALFLAAMAAVPLVGLVPAAAVAPALIIVGIMMMEPVLKIDFSDYTEAVPAFITIAAMPFTYSISNGISLGFLAYVLAKLLTGRGRQVAPVMCVLAALFLAFFALSPTFR